jgi:hypothetical protein
MFNARTANKAKEAVRSEVQTFKSEVKHTIRHKGIDNWI